MPAFPGDGAFIGIREGHELRPLSGPIFAPDPWCGCKGETHELTCRPHADALLRSYPDRPARLDGTLHADIARRICACCGVDPAHFQFPMTDAAEALWLLPRDWVLLEIKRRTPDPAVYDVVIENPGASPIQYANGVHRIIASAICLAAIRAHAAFGTAAFVDPGVA